MTAPLRPPLRLLRALCVLALAAACGGGRGDLRPLSAPIGEGLSVRALFAGDELVYAFVAAPQLIVTTRRDPEGAGPQKGLAFCFGVEDGLLLDGRPLERPAGTPVFAVTAAGSVAPIELTAGERAALSRELRLVRGELGEAELAARLRAALREAEGR